MYKNEDNNIEKYVLLPPQDKKPIVLATMQREDHKWTARNSNGERMCGGYSRANVMEEVECILKNKIGALEKSNPAQHIILIVRMSKTIANIWGLQKLYSDEDGYYIDSGCDATLGKTVEECAESTIEIIEGIHEHADPELSKNIEKDKELLAQLKQKQDLAKLREIRNEQE